MIFFYDLPRHCGSCDRGRPVCVQVVLHPTEPAALFLCKRCTASHRLMTEKLFPATVTTEEIEELHEEGDDEDE